MNEHVITPIAISELANIVPMSSELEQIALNQEIAIKGFTVAMGLIALWKGKIVDGRCRQIAILAAGLNPMDYTMDLGDLTEQEVIAYVKSVNIRRNLTDTQKILSAYNEWKITKGMGQAQSAKSWGVSPTSIKNATSMVKSIETIKKHPSIILFKEVKKDTRVLFEKITIEELFQSLFDGHAVQIDDKLVGTKSVKAIAKYLKAFIESKDLVIEKETFEWNPDGVIKTERGKEHYYRLVANVQDMHIKMALVDYVNLKYRLDDTVNIAIPEEVEPLVKTVVSEIPELGTPERAAYIDGLKKAIEAKQAKQRNKVYSAEEEALYDSVTEKSANNFNENLSLFSSAG